MSEITSAVETVSDIVQGIVDAIFVPFFTAVIGWLTDLSGQLGQGLADMLDGLLNMF